MATQHLIEGYLTTSRCKEKLIPFIADKLLCVPLVVLSSRKPNHQRLVLYPAAGKPLVWERPQAEIEELVRRIREAAAG